MSIQFFVLCLTVGIILSSEVANAVKLVSGEIKCVAGPTYSNQWTGKMSPEKNTIAVLWTNENEKSFTEALQLSTATWTFAWEQDDEIKGQEDIFDLVVATEFSASFIKGLNCKTIQFHPKVKITVPDSEWLEGMLCPVQSRTPAGYLESSTYILFKDKTSTLVNFKAACEKQEYVQLTVYNVGGHKLYNIVLPLFGNLVPQVNPIGETDISTVTMEIPLGITLTINNKDYKGAIYLNLWQIKLCISKEEAEDLEQWFKLQDTVETCNGILREQDRIPGAHSNFTLQKLEMKTNDDSSAAPISSGRVVKLISFESIAQA